MKVKVAVYGTIGKVVSFDPNATAGAQIGVNLLMPDGSTATIAAIAAAVAAAIAAVNTTPTAHRLLSGLTIGDDHPQYLRKDTLTTAGDMYLATAPGIVGRLPVGPERWTLQVVGGVVQWAAPDTVLTWMSF